MAASPEQTLSENERRPHGHSQEGGKAPQVLPTLSFMRVSHAKSVINSELIYRGSKCPSALFDSIFESHPLQSESYNIRPPKNQSKDKEEEEA